MSRRVDPVLASGYVAAIMTLTDARTELDRTILDLAREASDAGVPYKEIAPAMGVSHGTLAARLREARS